VADVVDKTEFLPTIAAAAGITLSRDYKPDGRSFLPQIRGERGEPRGWIYSWYAPYGELKHEFAADAQWKLYRTGAFFNTATDPQEKESLPLTSLRGEAASAAARLQAALDQYKDARPPALLKARPKNAGRDTKDPDD